MPAPTIEPTTMAVSEKSGSFPLAADSAGDAVVAGEDAISFPLDRFPRPAPRSAQFFVIMKYLYLDPEKCRLPLRQRVGATGDRMRDTDLEEDDGPRDP
jgi:hypothetical protein